MIATEKRHAAFPDVPTFRELGFNWVDGAHRGIAMPKADAGRDPESSSRTSCSRSTRTRGCAHGLTDGGYDVIDITLEKMPAFMAEKSRAYVEDAKAAGLLK